MAKLQEKQNLQENGSFGENGRFGTKLREKRNLQENGRFGEIGRTQGGTSGSMVSFVPWEKYKYPGDFRVSIVLRDAVY